MSNSVRLHRQQLTRLRHPWDSPGKNTGVGCPFLLQSMKVKSECEVAQSCPTLHDPMDCSPPGSSVHGIFQARVLEWGVTAFSLILFNSHLTCLLRKLYVGQEATIRTGCGTTDGFQIEKGVHQGCILSPAYLTYMQSTS